MLINNGGFINDKKLCERKYFLILLKVIYFKFRKFIKIF